MNAKEITIPIHIDRTGIDEATEKMNRLSELLAEVNQIIDSLRVIKLEVKVGSEQPKTINIDVRLDGNKVTHVVENHD